mmetsp:Transcript_40039/g.68304  ORF Transcript_40039/g.68304 Transcript_40039/m.68304 type:complete len:111 (+) Transcript_40039:722-1054(+)
MLTKTKDELDQVKQMAAELQGVKVATPVSSAATNPVAEAAMKSAVAAAKAAVEEFGEGSTEATLAWETVEEIASSSNSIASQPSLEEECLIELIEGCEALEKFKTVLDSR